MIFIILTSPFCFCFNIFFQKNCLNYHFSVLILFQLLHPVNFCYVCLFSWISFCLQRSHAFQFSNLASLYLVSIMYLPVLFTSTQSSFSNLLAVFLPACLSFFEPLFLSALRSPHRSGGCICISFSVAVSFSPFGWLPCVTASFRTSLVAS